MKATTKLILAVLVSLTLLYVLACLPVSETVSQSASQPVTQTASQPASFTLPSVLTIKCEEDMTCWNCHTMGNRQCAPSAEDYANDAQALLATVTLATTPDYETIVTYEGAYNHDAATPGNPEFSIQSVRYPNTYHLFSVTADPYPSTDTAAIAPATTAPATKAPAKISSAIPPATLPTVSQPTASLPISQPALATAKQAETPTKGSTADTAPACGDLKLGDAWAGAGTVCRPVTAPHGEGQHVGEK